MNAKNCLGHGILASLQAGLRQFRTLFFTSPRIITNSLPCSLRESAHVGWRFFLISSRGKNCDLVLVIWNLFGFWCL